MPVILRITLWQNTLALLYGIIGFILLPTGVAFLFLDQPVIGWSMVIVATCLLFSGFLHYLTQIELEKIMKAPVAKKGNFLQELYEEENCK